jgi:hypothetical protein
MADLAAVQPQMPAVTPDDIPNLSDPSAYPDQPITSGLPMGPGAGPEVLQNRDPRIEETKKLQRWMPLLDIIGDDPETPDSVRSFIRYVRSA